MTDRHAGYVVTLAKDIREDDAEHIINAMRMIKGVADVSPIISDYNVVLARGQRDMAWREAIIHLLDEGPHD